MGIIHTKLSIAILSKTYLEMHFAILLQWLYLFIRPLQFNNLSYKLFLEKKILSDSKKKKKKVTFGVLRTKWFSNFLSDFKKKGSYKNILCKGDSRFATSPSWQNLKRIK